MALRKKKDEKQFENLSFEDGIKNLTEIVNQIETGQVPLAESLEKYEKGMSIIRRCRQILLEAEKRIQDISAEQDQYPTAAQPQGQDTEEEETEETVSPSDAEEQEKEEGLF